MTDAAGVCPLCGGPNRCGVALGQGVCWCFSVQVPEAVLAAVPEAQRVQSCVCEACVEKQDRAAEQVDRHDLPTRRAMGVDPLIALRDQ